MIWAAGKPCDQGHVFVQPGRTRRSTTKPERPPTVTGFGPVTLSAGSFTSQRTNAAADRAGAASSPHRDPVGAILWRTARRSVLPLSRALFSQSPPGGTRPKFPSWSLKFVQPTGMVYVSAGLKLRVVCVPADTSPRHVPPNGPYALRAQRGDLLDGNRRDLDAAHDRVRRRQGGVEFLRGRRPNRDRERVHERSDPDRGQVEPRPAGAGGEGRCPAVAAKREVRAGTCGRADVDALHGEHRTAEPAALSRGGVERARCRAAMPRGRSRSARRSGAARRSATTRTDRAGTRSTSILAARSR